MKLIFGLIFIFLFASGTAYSVLPSSFDLRDVNGTNKMTSVKSQSGGTCWTFGTMGAMESNLKVTGNWADGGETGEPDLAEYHLDWWNGFNQHNNDDTDPPTGGGLEVHMGGDYRVAAAYMTRGEGAVRDSDGQSYSTPPERSSNTYHYYYPKHIEWFSDDNSLYNIDTIKNVVMEKGAIGTCMCWDWSFWDSANGTHYQPPSDANEPNHAIVIAGWDDSQVTQAPTNGAWLCKNSWGSTWNGDGYFWISYYDKHCGKHPEMGAVSFKNVERQFYNNIYNHDYHGWRDTFSSNTALNVFYTRATESLEAVSFYTVSNEVEYTIKIFDSYANGILSGEVLSQTGAFEHAGFHTVDLNEEIPMISGGQFCVFLELSHGGQAFDRTSEIPLLLFEEKPGPEINFEKYLVTLGKSQAQGIVVESSANGGESFYWNGMKWIDFTNINSTANFCMKGLTVPVPEPRIVFSVQYSVFGLFLILQICSGRLKASGQIKSTLGK